MALLTFRGLFFTFKSLKLKNICDLSEDVTNLFETRGQESPKLVVPVTTQPKSRDGD